MKISLTYKLGIGVIIQEQLISYNKIGMQYYNFEHKEQVKIARKQL